MSNRKYYTDELEIGRPASGLIEDFIPVAVRNQFGNLFNLICDDEILLGQPLANDLKNELELDPGLDVDLL
jgi:hypothetical protein